MSKSGGPSPAAIVSAVGNIVAGFGQFQASRARASALRQSARVARGEGAMEAQLAVDEGERAAATAVTRGAASGGGAGGSFADVLSDLEQTAMFNARSAIWASESDALNREHEAKVEKMNGRYALLTSVLQSSATIGGDMMRGAEQRKQAAAKRRLYREGAR